MRKVQPVSFNLSDQYEEVLYTFATSNGAFSKYIKRLIQWDMEKKIPINPVNKSPIPTKKAPTTPHVIQGNASTLNGFKLE